MAEKKVNKKSEPVKHKAVVKKAAIKKSVEVTPPVTTKVHEVKPIEPQKIETTSPEAKPQNTLDRGALFLGASLLVIGAVWLIGHFLNVSLAGYVWPFAIIIPGILLFISALNMQSGSGEGFSVVGSILTATGLLLLFQMVTHTWASWAYAWALIAPTSIGLGQMIFGKLKGNETLQKNGWMVARVGLIIFAIGFVFFELVIGLHGFGLRNFGLPVLPVLVIAVGLLILVRAMTAKR